MQYAAAIIGHGRSPEGRKWGPLIDACDMVVRMWNWRWQDEADYGSRYDYGLIEASPELIRTFHEHNATTPSCGYIASKMHGHDRCRLPNRTELVDQGLWCQLGRQMGGLGETGRLQLTRGTIAACWAISRANVGDRVILVGFDNVEIGRCQGIEEGFSEAYRSDPSIFSFRGYAPGETKHGNHDFGIELALMQRLALRNGVKLWLAQHIWP